MVWWLTATRRAAAYRGGVGGPNEVLQQAVVRYSTMAATSTRKTTQSNTPRRCLSTRLVHEEEHANSPLLPKQYLYPKSTRRITAPTGPTHPLWGVAISRSFGSSATTPPEKSSNSKDTTALESEASSSLDSTTTIPSSTSDDDDDDSKVEEEAPKAPPKLARNHGLESVIAQGMAHLKDASTFIQQSKEAKKPLFAKAVTQEEEGPNTTKQLAEANRVLIAATECLERLTMRNKRSKNILAIDGYPILLLHVDVNANLREATVYWALPFEILLEVNEETRMKFTQRMQDKIDNHGGGSFLQKEVHRVLSAYYPPKLKFKPASDVLLQQLLQF